MNERLLLIRLGALGDLVLCGDAFHTLRAAFPDAHLTLMTGSPFKAFAQSMPWFNAVISDPRPKAWALPQWLSLGRELRAAKPTHLFDFHGKPRSQLYRHLFLPRQLYVSSCRPYKKQHPHMSDWLQAQLAAAGYPVKPADWSWLTGDLVPFALPRKYILLIPGSAPQHPQKRWPAAHFSLLAKAMPEIGFVIVGTKAEESVAATIASSTPNALNLVGRTSLAEVAALARGATGVIGNDTGPTHLASMVGAKTLMLMGAYTNPDRSRPRGARSAFLRKDDLTALTPAEVTMAFERLQP